MTISFGFAAETGSVSFSGVLEGHVTFSCKVRKCGSTSVYSEANESHSYTRRQLDQKKILWISSIFSKTNSKIVCVTGILYMHL